MGCKPSKLQIQENGDLFNEDIDVRKRLLTGLQMSRGDNGIEGNLQVAFVTSRVKRFERVSRTPMESIPEELKPSQSGTSPGV